MKEMTEIIEFIPIIKWSISGLLSGGVLTFLLSKWLGKKKEEVELALDWQKFYNEHIETIKKIHEEEIESIKELHKKQIEDIKLTFKDEIKALVKKMDSLKDDKEQLEKERRLWENDSIKKNMIIKDQKNIMSEQERIREKQYLKIEKLKKEISIVVNGKHKKS